VLLAAGNFGRRMLQTAADAGAGDEEEEGDYEEGDYEESGGAPKEPFYVFATVTVLRDDSVRDDLCGLYTCCISQSLRFFPPPLPPRDSVSMQLPQDSSVEGCNLLRTPCHCGDPTSED
jgi:hypothetical protein